jgi:hypothetical protein
MTALSTIDLPDYKMQVRDALHQLRLVQQVLTRSVHLLERQQVPPEPVMTPEAIARERIATLPDDAELTEAEASAWLVCSVSLLRQWRWQARGPAFEGAGKTVRYRKSVLDQFKAE